MNIEEIIRKITLEVLKQMEYGKMAPKKVLMPSEQAFNIGEGFETVVMTAEDDVENAVQNSEVIVISKLTIDEMIEISLGQRKSIVSQMIITGLLMGKEVVVLSEGLEYRKYMTSASKPLYELYKSYEVKIAEFGAVIIEEENLLGALTNKCANAEKDVYSCNVEAYDARNKKLVDYSLIQNVIENKNSKVLVDKKTLITAMAKDLIREQQIEIEIV